MPVENLFDFTSNDMLTDVVGTEDASGYSQTGSYGRIISASLGGVVFEHDANQQTGAPFDLILNGIVIASDPQQDSFGDDYYLNDYGAMAYTDSTSDLPMIIDGQTNSELPQYPVSINNRTVPGPGGSSIHAWQILGFEDLMEPAIDPVSHLPNGQYTQQTDTPISDLLNSEAQNAWTAFAVTGINDNGAIVGTATYTPPSTLPSDPVPSAGSHGVMLIPAAFQLRDVNNVSSGWDSPASSTDGNAWTMVSAPSGGSKSVNSLVKLVLPANASNLGLECVVDDTDSGYSTSHISIPTINLSATSANIDITGLAATDTTPKTDPYNHPYTTVSPKPARVVLRQKQNKQVVLTLNVVVLNSETVPVNIVYADDPQNANSLISNPPSTSTIISNLNAAFQPQGNITFSLYGTKHVNGSGDFDGNGALDYNGTSNQYLYQQPGIGDVISQAIYQIPGGIITIIVVKQIKDTSPGGEAIGVTQGIQCLVNSSAGSTVFAHEVGHALGLSSQFQGQANAHDLGPWPPEFQTIGYINPEGLMYPQESGTFWLRSGDWSQANDQAVKIKP